MQTILEMVAAPKDRFQPKTPEEFFALQLARKLGDSVNVHHHLALTRRHSPDLLMQAYRVACAEETQPTIERFDAALMELAGSGGAE